MARRDTGQKLAVKEQEMLTTVENLLVEIQHNLYAKARVNLENMITSVQTYEEFREKLKTKGGFIKAAWCGSPTCEAKVKDETGATIRLRPFEREKPKTGCIVCGEKAEEIVYFARSY
jgi:prolyl-tRNA synthetase